MKVVCDFVYKKAAIVLDVDKDYLVDSRLRPLAKSWSDGDMEKMVQLLKSGSDRRLENDIVEALTTNETYFFRDEHPFEALTKAVLPSIIEKRLSSRKLRIWCGAASTGQEPYSILMTLFENLPNPASWDIDFIATDINQTVLDKAREGVYKQHEVTRGLPAQLLSRYFDRKGSDWVVKEQLRQSVKFQCLNLIEAWPFRENFDIIFLRNVLIYFDVDVKREILSKTRRILAPDGTLFLGGAETTVNLDDTYASCREGRSVFYKKAA